jgi:hypothetical protein
VVCVDEIFCVKILTHTIETGGFHNDSSTVTLIAFRVDILRWITGVVFVISIYVNEQYEEQVK